MVVPQGIANPARLVAALEEPEAGLPEAARELGRVLLDQIETLTVRTKEPKAKILKRARESEAAKRLMGIPGVGPVCAMAFLAFAPPMEEFRRGCDFLAWLGLIPRQRSTGGKPKLGKVSKMCQRDLRRLLISGAIADIRWTDLRGTNDPWLEGMLARKPSMVVAVALANKTARTMWAMTMNKECYRPRTAAA